MASNKKWFRRALRALSYGEMDLWNILKQKLPDERRIYLENKYLPQTPVVPPTTIENKEEPKTAETNSLKTTVESEAAVTVTPKIKPTREKKEPKVTKTKTTRQRTKSQTKKTKKTSQGG